MPIKDNKSGSEFTLVALEDATGDGVFQTPAIDTADYGNGITFVPYITVLVAGTTTFDNVQDSPDGTTDWQNVASGNINGPIVGDTLGAASAGDILQTVGVFGTRRFLRLVFTFSGTTTDTQLRVIANGGIEVTPAASDT